MGEGETEMKKGNKYESEHLKNITAEEIKQVEDNMDNFTRELIDLHMYDFCPKVKALNYGELRVVRLYLENKLLEVDSMIKELEKQNKIRTRLLPADIPAIGNLYAVCANIDSKRGFLDHLLSERKLQF